MKKILLYNSGGGLGDSIQIITLINTLRSGGAQQALVSLLENFKIKSFEVILIVLDKKHKINSKIYNKNNEYLKYGKNTIKW